jgi:CheY-like chemotaxis protein
MTDVLVVDDSDDIRVLTRRMLERRGHSVRAAADAEEALDMLLAAPPQVMLLDLQLPGRSGSDLLDELRERGLLDDVRVVLFSAQVNPKALGRGGLAAADGYLSKPFTQEQLIASVEDGSREKRS